MQALLYAVLLQSAWSWASPLDKPTLSVHVRDIIANDLSAYEGHSNYKTYLRWLDTPGPGSHIKRDAPRVFEKHPNIVSIDCGDDKESCLLVSRMAFHEIAKTPAELELLKRSLEAQVQAKEQDAADPSVLFGRSLQKRANTDSQLITTHFKTYHDLGPDNREAGYQHYLSWNLKCQTLQFSSSGFQLTSTNVRHWYGPTGGTQANLFATLLDDADSPPDQKHGVTISITFDCNYWWGGKCCVQSVQTLNAIGDEHSYIPPHTEPLECVSIKDVGGENCGDDPAATGWCGLHVTQYQKNEGPGLNTENYRFSVTIRDAKQVIVGDEEYLSIPSGMTTQLGTKPLQYTLGLTAPNVDADPIAFAYAGQTWDTNDSSHCKMGKYDNGKREGDCGFTCNS